MATMNPLTQTYEGHVRHSRLPWFRGNAFMSITAFLMCLAAVFVLPPKGKPTTGQWLLIAFYFLMALAWVGNVLSDREKPDWIKQCAAIVLLLLFGWLVYMYYAANWKNLRHAFFNLEVMEGEWPGLFWGLWVTAQIAFWTIIFSTLIGLLLAVLRSFNNRVLNFFIIAYIDFFRAMPIIVLMVIVYYAFPYAGIRMSAMASGIFSLSLNSAAYVSEIFRAGFESIHYGQLEAARALGLTPVKTLRLVILPQAMRVVIPPMTGNYILMIKDTALCSTVTITELLKSAMQVQAWKANPTPFIAATLMYLILLLPLVRASSYLEWRLKTKQQRRHR